MLLASNLITEKDKVIEDLEPKAKYFNELMDNNLVANFRNTAILQEILGINTMSFLPSLHVADILVGTGVVILIKFIVYIKGKRTLFSSISVILPSGIFPKFIS